MVPVSGKGPLIAYARGSREAALPVLSVVTPLAFVVRPAEDVDERRTAIGREASKKMADEARWASSGLSREFEEPREVYLRRLPRRCVHTDVEVRVAWCGVVWCGVVWCGVVWCGVVWCGVVWCGVVWCGVVWCGVVWYGVMCLRR